LPTATYNPICVLDSETGFNYDGHAINMGSNTTLDLNGFTLSAKTGYAGVWGETSTGSVWAVYASGPAGGTGG